MTINVIPVPSEGYLSELPYAHVIISEEQYLTNQNQYSDNVALLGVNQFKDNDDWNRVLPPIPVIQNTQPVTLQCFYLPSKMITTEFGDRPNDVGSLVFTIYRNSNESASYFPEQVMRNLVYENITFALRMVFSSTNKVLPKSILSQIDEFWRHVNTYRRLRIAIDARTLSSCEYPERIFQSLIPVINYKGDFEIVYCEYY